MDGSEAAKPKPSSSVISEPWTPAWPTRNIRTDRHHRIRSDYNAWRVARSELYKAIENLDWQPLQEEISGLRHQV